MLLHTVKNYQYVIDYYSYTRTTNVDNVTTIDYAINPTAIRAGINTTMTGDIIVLTKEKLQIEGLLKNIIDRNSNQVFQNGVWAITQTQPLVNTFGYVEGYRYRAKIVSGNA